LPKTIKSFAVDLTTVEETKVTNPQYMRAEFDKLRDAYVWYFPWELWINISGRL